MGGYWGPLALEFTSVRFRKSQINLHEHLSPSRQRKQRINSRFGKTITSPLACRLSLLQRISYLWFLKLVVRRNHRFIQTYLCIYSRCVYFGVKLVHISCTIPLCIWAIRTKSIYNNKSSLTSLKQTYSVCNLILPLSVLHQLCMIPRSIEHSSNCLGSRRGRNIHATETCRSLLRFVYQQPTLLPVQRPSIR